MKRKYSKTWNTHHMNVNVLDLGQNVAEICLFHTSVPILRGSGYGFSGFFLTIL